MPDSSAKQPDTDEQRVRELYFDLLNAWNDRDASKMAALVAAGGTMIGFDGSTMLGPTEIESTLTSIFEHHATASFVAKIKSVRRIGSNSFVVLAVAGMVPPGGTAINPAVNAIQSLVTTRDGESWRIQLFQNTPAAFHGRPDAVEALTKELQAEFEARASRASDA